MYCVNCKERGHGAISRECPTFWTKKAAMDARNPATRFKYIVILDDPSTWEPGSPEYAPPPPTTSPPYPSHWRRPPRPKLHSREATPNTPGSSSGLTGPPGDPRRRPAAGPPWLGQRTSGSAPRSNSALRQQTLDNVFGQLSSSRQQQVAPADPPDGAHV